MSPSDRSGWNLPSNGVGQGNISAFLCWMGKQRHGCVSRAWACSGRPEPWSCCLNGATADMVGATYALHRAQPMTAAGCPAINAMSLPLVFSLSPLQLMCQGLALLFPTSEGHNLLLSTFCPMSCLVSCAYVPLPPSS